MDVPESGSRPQEAPGRRSFCPVLLASASKQSFWKASPTLHPDVLKRCHHQSVLPPETLGLPVPVQIRGLPEGAVFSAPGTRCPHQLMLPLPPLPLPPGLLGCSPEKRPLRPRQPSDSDPSGLASHKCLHSPAGVSVLVVPAPGVRHLPLHCPHL